MHFVRSICIFCIRMPFTPCCQEQAHPHFLAQQLWLRPQGRDQKGDGGKLTDLAKSPELDPGWVGFRKLPLADS